jgi:hypothetical protein
LRLGSNKETIIQETFRFLKKAVPLVTTGRVGMLRPRRPSMARNSIYTQYRNRGMIRDRHCTAPAPSTYSRWPLWVYIGPIPTGEETAFMGLYSTHPLAATLKSRALIGYLEMRLLRYDIN